ncbi:MAG: SPOR domain-containing protein, partial [Deltaproteobacteria bacterium]
MSSRAAWLTLLVLLVQCPLNSCSRGNESRGAAAGEPAGWLVVLKRCPGPKEAIEDARELGGKLPEGVQAGAARFAAKDGMYVVAAGAWGSREEAQSAAGKLAKGLGIE